ncbi:MAG TPA: FtsX-like permease family protein [Chryseolinea sp.]|nr:FtsX-like permease family protein [Chryseolinea sp.]
MSLFTLVWNYLKARPLNTAINILLLSLGIAVITILFLFKEQMGQKIEDNVRGVDLVVGAKGSPLQLILCNIFHVDYPTGNIKLQEAERISRNRLIKSSIPLALGDSYNTFRIVGTNREYANLFDAEIAEGEWWKNSLEVTIGANVHRSANLQLGEEFTSSHGLTMGGSSHNDHKYKVSGILKRTNSILDNLILTNVESIWKMHEEHDTVSAELSENTEQQVRYSKLVPSVPASDSVSEITSLLILYRSPLAAVQLPRLVNAQSSLQAASPAFETARLFSILGVGMDVLMGFAYVLILISALSIFIALYNSLKERRYDLAIMRSMGASRSKLFTSILLEGGILTLTGSFVGLLMGHGVLMLLSVLVTETAKAGITGLVFYGEEGIILGASLLLGLVCALIPAIQAYRTDISKVLAGN